MINGLLQARDSSVLLVHEGAQVVDQARHLVIGLLLVHGVAVNAAEGVRPDVLLPKVQQSGEGSLVLLQLRTVKRSGARDPVKVLDLPGHPVHL